MLNPVEVSALAFVLVLSVNLAVAFINRKR
jgi:hypothetical protein